MVDEKNLVKTIVLSNDWQEVLEIIIIDQGLDPMDVDITKLTGSFLEYLKTMDKFDFRIPARFILIAAILLRMKCELMFTEEKKKEEKENEAPKINIDNIPLLEPPTIRISTKPVTLKDLIIALEKAFEFKERKEEKRIRMLKLVENVISLEERDIESEIKDVLSVVLRKTKRSKFVTLYELVDNWKKSEIVRVFLPLLYLVSRDKIECIQKEMFKEIFIKPKVTKDEKDCTT